MVRAHPCGRLHLRHARAVWEDGSEATESGDAKASREILEALHLAVLVAPTAIVASSQGRVIHDSGVRGVFFLVNRSIRDCVGRIIRRHRRSSARGAAALRNDGACPHGATLAGAPRAAVHAHGIRHGRSVPRPNAPPALQTVRRACNERNLRDELGLGRKRCAERVGPHMHLRESGQGQ